MKSAFGGKATGMQSSENKSFEITRYVCKIYFPNLTSLLHSVTISYIELRLIIHPWGEFSIKQKHSIQESQRNYRKRTNHQSLYF
jgi:hypothetical protein